MANLMNFNFKSNEVRVIEKNGNPWFVAKDISDILEYSDTEAMTRRLDEDEKMLINSKNLQNVGFKIPIRGLVIINESGLYNAILGSNKSQAKEFKRWITHKVLPEIRKTGEYKLKKDRKTDLEYLQLKIEREKRLRALQLQRFLKENKNIDIFTVKKLNSEILMLLTNKKIPVLSKSKDNSFIVDNDLMNPIYFIGDRIFYSNKDYSIGDDVIVYYKGQKRLKRCLSIKDNKIGFYSIGNNSELIFDNECTVLGVVEGFQRNIFKRNNYDNNINIKKELNI